MDIRIRSYSRWILELLCTCSLHRDLAYIIFFSGPLGPDRLLSPHKSSYTHPLGCIKHRESRLSALLCPRGPIFAGGAFWLFSATTAVAQRVATEDPADETDRSHRMIRRTATAGGANSGVSAVCRRGKTLLLFFFLDLRPANHPFDNVSDPGGHQRRDRLLSRRCMHPHESYSSRHRQPTKNIWC